MMKMDVMAVNMKSIAVFEPKHGSQFFLPSPNNLFPVGKLSCFPLNSLPTKPPKFGRLKAACDQESKRTFEKLLPSPWTDQFHSVSVDVSEMDALRKETDVLKTKVMKNTLMFSKGIESTKKRILMINLLASLGLAHHFEEEIYEILEEGLEKEKEMMADEDDLHTVSIIFWFFRTYGHYISSDVFRRFKGNNGNFKESLKEDAKGILSLYEAAHLRTTTDYILDEALVFTSSHLESLDACGKCPPELSMRIQNALHLSHRWKMQNVAAMEYIPSYELEKDHDEMLLKFAKFNFKLLQLQCLQDLKVLTKWYTEADFASKVPPFYRERMVENFFFSIGSFYEPHLSRERIMLTQLYTVLALLDDTMDRYASLPEVESLADSLQGWAPNHAMDKQPDYLKFVLKFILDTNKEFEREVSQEGKPYGVKATASIKEEFKNLAKAHCDLAKWVGAAHVPSFEEYVEVGIVEFAVYPGFALVFMFLGNMASKEADEWLKSRPKLIKLLCLKSRLKNDIYGFEGDMSRGYITNAVNCYMKQYGVTKEEAVRELLKILIDVDKKLNEELLVTTGVSRLALNAVLDLIQVVSSCYNGYEGFTDHVGKITQYMNLMFVDRSDPSVKAMENV